jgi:prepilin-type N-terminal cleavage/methylation domain-containing protein
MSKKGFTLIETLVAVTILIIGVIGPLTIAARGIADGFFARNQIAANYLAQEAVEVIFSKVMGSKLFVRPVWEGLEDCLVAGTTCRVDAQDGSVSSANCASGGCNLVFDSNNGYFRSPSDPGITPVGPVFLRKVEIEPLSGEPDDPDEVRLTVTVEWYNLAMGRKLVLVENLYRY